MNEIKEHLSQYEKLLPVGKSLSFPEAERRAGEFLSAMASITNYRHIFSEERIKFTTIQSVVYAEELSEGTAKTVTENKVTVEASPAYTEARESLERIENDINYLKAFYEVFNNAHIFYRNMAKGDNT